MVQLKPALTVRRFEPGDHEQWDSFVERSVEGTFMHSRTFLSYHPPERFDDCSLIVIDDRDHWRAVFPAAAIVSGNTRILQSHPGATYGGIMMPEDTVTVQIDSIISSIADAARSEGFDQIRMRTPERIFRRRNFDELDTACFRAGFRIEGRELSCALRLNSSTRNELLERWRPLGRRHLRSAEKSGVTVRITDDFTEFWRILERTLDARHSAHPAHTLAEIQRLRDLLPGRVLLVGGYLNERLISGTVLFLFNSTAAHTFYIAQDYDFAEYNSLPSVMLAAAEFCRDKGFAWMNFGISSEPGTLGHELNHGLYGFKRSCGGEGVTRDLWSLSLTNQNP